jgi:LmbE family N-acetylglucosaminyl deacetylase
MKTLVVAPHPDDEILGCGGTLLRRKAAGAELAWLIVTGISDVAGWPAERVAQRDKEIDAVSKAVGFDEVFNLRLRTAFLDHLPMSEVINGISNVFKTFQPEEVFVPHYSDVHSDHRVVFDAVSACTKWFRYPSVKRVVAYETISETEFGMIGNSSFKPNYFVDISQFIHRKLEIMGIYQSELQPFPFPRSIEAIRALASVRGAASGFLSAEAFELLRERS